jgi:CTP:molybdopterin cytidylyltransferase MocA
MAVTGDVGARHIIASVAEAVAEVAVTDPAITVDVDTPDVLAKISETAR